MSNEKAKSMLEELLLDPRFCCHPEYIREEMRATLPMDSWNMIVRTITDICDEIDCKDVT